LPDEQEAGAEVERSWIDVVLYAVGLLSGIVAVVWGGSRIFSFINGVPGTGRGTWISGCIVAQIGVAAIVATAVVAGRALAVPSSDADSAPSPEKGGFRRRFEVAQLGAAGIAGAILVLAVGRDLSANLEGLNNQIRLMHLVTYNYRRPWPPSLDFTPTLAAFTVAGAVLCFALVAARARRHVVMALVTLGVVFGTWGVDIYFMKISPHWGQRETTVAYYDAAREAPGPLVAYQMNWKGENFFTGNHVPAFVSSGKKFQDYVLDEKKKGLKTFYFVTEHGRTTTLSNELGPTKEFEKLTTPELDNKFVLVRARFE
jgi:hypothetical protein